jgi:hypothetical protein
VAGQESQFTISVCNVKKPKLNNVTVGLLKA